MSNRKKIRRKPSALQGDIKSAKSADGVIKYKLDPERDARIEREKQRQKDVLEGQRIYRDFFGRLTARKHTPGEVIEKFSALITEIENRIQNEGVRNYIINDIIYPSINKFHESKVIADNTMLAVVDCPKCEWGGKAIFSRSVWEAGGCKMDCPECKQPLSQAGGEEGPDMISEEEGRKIAEKGKAL